jgi:streptogramin lyase
MTGLRSLVVCLGFCFAGLTMCVSAALAEGTSPGGVSGGSSLTEGALVTPGSPTEGEGLQAQEEAKRSSPEAVAKREASRTEFEGLDAEQAVKLAGEAFPKLVDEPAGGPPKLPAGQSITGYVSDNAASLDLGEGKHGVLESMAPIALETSSGQRTPVDLSLREAGGAFEPKTPVVGASIPKRLSAGVSLSGIGVSLTPVDGSGVPLGGSEGVIDGASVLYANTQNDMDSLVKPTTDGFAADTLLRSVISPQQLFFRVGLPAGASLVQARDGSGDVEVVKEDATIATVLPPGAQDATGTAVPVSMSVSEDTLVLSVADHAAEYQYPVEVDPEVTGKDVQLTKESSKRSNWEFYTGKGNGKKDPSTNFSSSEEGGILKTYGVHEYAEKEEAFWVYQTRGVSKIYEFEGETEASNKEDRIESIIELQYGEVKTESGITEAKEVLSTETGGTSEYKRKALPKVLCPSGEASCPSSAGHEGNAVHFQQSVVNGPTGRYSFSDELDKGTVYISEPEIENSKKEKEKIHSTTSENTTSPEFEVEVENAKKEKEKQIRKNALNGTSNWLSEYEGAIQFISKDPGIGVAKSWLEYDNSGKWEAVSGSEHNYLEEGLCKGVQCEAEQKEYWTLNPHLPNGEDKIRYRAEEALGDATHETASLETEGVGTVKVDTSKPHSIYLGGLPFANELSEKSYKFTAYATDGEGPTIPSSGIASLVVSIENSKGEKKEIAKTGGTGECLVSKGECTASAEYTINGAELGAGHHGIVIVAKDRAGNEGREEEEVSVRHSTPVPLGPGDVDLESGDFTLGPTDVALGGGLSVSRVYSSRDLTAGVEQGSLLGPQWNLSVGSEESLFEMVDKSVLVTSGNGGQTVFAAVFNSKGEPTGKFEAPPGDSNLTLALEENGKHEQAYYLKDSAAGTSTEFLLSSTAKVWVPSSQEGPVPTDTVSYIYETAEVRKTKVTRPKEERGATVAKVSCSAKPEPGCRALKFTYAAETTAKGENRSEWGEYLGELSKVSYEGYNPATKKMTETPVPVAEYSYDDYGRLRAEWDPRLTTPLKTTYGYEQGGPYGQEGPITALDLPGQEPWTFTYGTTAGDAGTGRLIKEAQAPSSAGLWNGEMLTAPSKEGKIAGTPTAGSRLGVTNPTWTGAPLAYEYQWEECKGPEYGCEAILGATNQYYIPTTADIGHELDVKVTAINGGGSGLHGSKTLPRTGVIKAATEYVLPTDSKLAGLALGSDGNMWFMNKAPGKEAAIGKVTASGTITEYPLGGTGDSERIEIVSGPESDLWAATCCATESKGKIDKIATSGTITEYTLPKEGRPSDLVTGPDGNLWFLERNWDGSKDPRVAKITPSGTVTEYALSYNPSDLIVGPDKNLWFMEPEADAVVKMTTAGVATKYGTGVAPLGLTSGPDKNLWFTKAGGIGKMTTAGVVTTYPLPTGREGEAHLGEIVTGPDSNLWFTLYGTTKAGETTTDTYSVMGKITTGGTITEYNLANAEDVPQDLISMSGGDLWFSENGGKIGSITTAGVSAEYPLLTEYNSTASLAAGPNGNVWFDNRDAHWNELAFEEGAAIEKLNATPEGETYTPQAGFTLEYGVPIAGSGAPHEMSASEVAKWGQKAEEAPEEATAILPADSPQGWPASSYTRASVYYLDSQGRLVNTAAPSTGTYGSIYTSEYNETNDVVRTLTPDNRAKALEAGGKSAEVAKLLSTENTYNGEGEKEAELPEPGTRLVVSRGPEHMVKYVAGEEHYEAGEKPKEGMARSLTKYFYNEGAPTENPRTKKKEAYDLVTATQNYAELINGEGKGSETVDVSETKTGYSGQEDLGWELRAATSVTAAPGSQDLTSTTEYYESGEAMGKVKETRTPKGSGGKSAHDTKIGYYSLEEDKEYPNCEKHPEWAGLVCETGPAKQPETTGVPNLAVTKISYNIWNEPETTVETFPKSGSFAEHTRTTKDEYDAAGRLKTSEETSTATTETADKALPKVTEEYNTVTGALERQSTTVGTRTKTITSVYNTLGQLESYTDADGNVAKFKYAGPENDGVLEEMSDSSAEGTSNQKYTYSSTTKQMEKMVDSAAGTFTTSYDTEGKLSSEVYPSGMCANYADNSVGEATGIEYVKSTTCSDKSAGVWFSETKVPSIRGEVMSKTSTLADEEYGYDTVGRLTEVHETPVGEYCKTRLYEYEAESNRTKETTREPNSTKECATEGGTEEKHTYDEANRLTDSGITYDSLGNVIKLPSGDAEGHALESTFYVDNAVATQTQNGVVNDYYMDPAGRVRETITGAKKVIAHYDGSGEAVAWTCEGAEKAETCETGGKWTRNIPGIDGTLTAVENGKGATIETPILQLHDLEGDVVATIKDKTGETKLESTYNPTEFGVPNGGKEPPKFAWLGAGGVEKSLASGVITEGATSYVPQTGRALQSEEVAPPGLPDGSGGQAASFTASAWNLQGAERVGAEAPGLEAEREREAAAAALKACEESGSCDPPRTLYFDAEEVAVFTGLLNAQEIALSGWDALEKIGITVAGFAKEVVEELIEHAINIHTPGEWSKAITTDFNACLGVMISGYSGQTLNYVRCAITTPWSEIAIPIIGKIAVPDFFGMPSASYCLYYSEHCGAYDGSNNTFVFPSGRKL